MKSGSILSPPGSDITLSWLIGLGMKLELILESVHLVNGPTFGIMQNQRFFFIVLDLLA